MVGESLSLGRVRERLDLRRRVESRFEVDSRSLAAVRIALGLQINADIWTDDEDFEEQHKVDVWKTHELVDHLDG